MEPVDRRTFLGAVAGATALGSLEVASTPLRVGAATRSAVFISTWPHGKPANEQAAQVYVSGGSLLDAVEKGINVTENDPEITSVGYGGLPNAEGEVELDAAIMDGTRHRAGAICNLHTIKNPISVARQVLEKTRHTTMAGAGALRFAIAMGFVPQQLLTDKALDAWLKWKNTPDHRTFWIDGENHDTIGMLGANGSHVVSGCSTSGLAWKIPGRVADSPLVGCGVFADDNAGAASATGDGDVMANYCTSARIVFQMERGLHPQEACEEVLRQMVRTNPATKQTQAAVIAITPSGEIGAAAMNAATKFQYALWRNGLSSLVDSAVVF
ncbi:MAG TPA: N(4)-(beta-N-acetylglucosaminyl)-L-asparaginase [Candidatus Rubrimentiphilum sp.]|nr:N(4)-(beta-N-acetylglucosaminyl)-L-asparaginase [Candidatus Rubrimentiphilum sp.]